MLSSDISRDFVELEGSKLEKVACAFCGGRFSPNIIYERGLQAKRDIDIVGIRKDEVYHPECLRTKLSG